MRAHSKLGGLGTGAGGQPFRRPRTHTVTLLRCCGLQAAPLLRPCCAPAAPLLRPCCAPAAPLLRPCCAPAAPLLRPACCPSAERAGKHWQKQPRSEHCHDSLLQRGPRETLAQGAAMFKREKLVGTHTCGMLHVGIALEKKGNSQQCCPCWRTSTLQRRGCSPFGALQQAKAASRARAGCTCPHRSTERAAASLTAAQQCRRTHGIGRRCGAWAWHGRRT
jgi:hypothetical protein